MPDFHQSGAITTLHRLAGPGTERLERELLHYHRARPVALVLPCLFSEMRGPGLKGIVDALRGVRYLRQVVVSLSGSQDRSEYEEIRSFFEGVRTLNGDAPIFLWNDGPRLQHLFQRLRQPDTHRRAPLEPVDGVYLEDYGIHIDPLAQE